jgi:hypothetical protein
VVIAAVLLALAFAEDVATTVGTALVIAAVLLALAFAEFVYRS